MAWNRMHRRRASHVPLHLSRSHPLRPAPIPTACSATGASIPSWSRLRGIRAPWFEQPIQFSQSRYSMDSLHPGAKQLFEKVGTYILPGRVRDPVRGLEEAKDAERIGLGAVWISERYATKEPAVLSGAVSQLVARARITATMYVTLRNP